MEQKRQRNRGLEEVAHFFFSSKPAQGSAAVAGDPARVFALISLVPDIPIGLVTATLALELATLHKKVLIAETDGGALNIFFAFGMERLPPPVEGILSHRMSGLIAQGPPGIKLLSVPLDPRKLTLLDSVSSGTVLKRLIREESRSDIFLVSINGPLIGSVRGEESSIPGASATALDGDQAAVRVICEAWGLLLLAPSHMRGLKRAYGMAKVILRRHASARIGVLLCHEGSSGDPERCLALVSGAAEKFLGKRLQEYGVLISERSLYASALSGTPLCRNGDQNPNTTVLAQTAQKLSNEIWGRSALPDRVRAMDRRMLVEALTAPPGRKEVFDTDGLLTGEEHLFFEQGFQEDS